MTRRLTGCAVTVGVSAAMVLAATPSLAAVAVKCAGTIGPGTITRNVIAESGCEVAEGTTIDGSVKVTGGDFVADGSNITGNFTARGAGTTTLRSSNVGGNVRVEDSGEVVIQGSPSTIGGDVRIRRDAEIPEVEHLRVGGSVVVVNNVSTHPVTWYPGIVDVETPGTVEFKGNEATGMEPVFIMVSEVTAGTLRVTHNSLLEFTESGKISPAFQGLLKVVENHVSANLTYAFNHVDRPYFDPDAFSYNTVGGTLTCRRNYPWAWGAPGNTAAKFSLQEC